MQKFIKKGEGIGASGISPLQQRRDSGDEQRPRSKDQVLQEHQRMMQ